MKEKKTPITTLGDEYSDDAGGPILSAVQTAAKSALGGNWIQLLGGMAGGAQSVYNSMFGKDSMERIREKEVNQALNQNLGNRELLLNQSPEANRQAKSQVLQSGLANVIAQAQNVGASAGSNAGLGGDVSSAQLSGLKTAPSVMAAASPYSQALAGTYTEKAGEQAQLNQQLDQNTLQRGQLAEMTAYYNQKSNSPFLGLLSGIATGAGALTSIEELMNIGKKKIDDKSTPPEVPKNMPITNPNQDYSNYGTNIMNNMGIGNGNTGYNDPNKINELYRKINLSGIK